MSAGTIPEIFLNTTKTYADKRLFFSKSGGKWTGLTGKKVRHDVEKLTAHFLLQKIQKGDRIAVLAGNSPRWAVVDYAIACSGAVSVPIYPNSVLAKIKYILLNCTPKLIVLENVELYQKLHPIWDSLPNVQEFIFLIAKGVRELPQSKYYDAICKGKHRTGRNLPTIETLSGEIQPNDYLTIIYTAVPDPDPAGVVLTHRNMVSNIEGALERIPLFQDDVMMSYLPLNHALERMAGHFTPFKQGCSIYYIQNIRKMAKHILEIKPSIVVGSPRFFEKLNVMVREEIEKRTRLFNRFFKWGMRTGNEYYSKNLAGDRIGFFLKKKHDLARWAVFSKIKEICGGNVRFFIAGGAPLLPQITEYFQSIGLLILEGYGLTEAGPVLTTNTENEFRIGSVGKPLPNVEIRLAPDGEILARGPNITPGYYKDDTRTAKAFDSEGWYYTGDIGIIDGDGFLKITDRKKNIVVTSGGKNISPAPLENALARSKYIRQAVIIGDKHRFISAFLVPDFPALKEYLTDSDKTCADEDAIVDLPEVHQLIEGEVERINEKFCHYEQIKKFAILSSLPTGNGRRQKSGCPEIRNKLVEKFSDIVDGFYQES